MELDRMIKTERMSIEIHSTKRTRDSSFCSHREEAYMKMIVHVANAIENDHYSVTIRTYVLFFLSPYVFPTILEPGTCLLRLEGFLGVPAEPPPPPKKK